VRIEAVSQSPFDLFKKEFPEPSERYDSLVDSQRKLRGLDPKMKQLLDIGIQTAIRNPRGVRFHALMARQGGASRDEVIGAVAMHLHLVGLAAVLDSLPSAVEGYEGK